MKHVDLANLMDSWDRSLTILIDHLDRKEPEIALQRAMGMREMIRKQAGYIDEETELIRKI